MTLRERMLGAWRLGAKVVLARPQPPDPADQAAWSDAVALWDALFEPFSPLVEGADVLELGCGDGRMLGALAGGGGARSAVGVERHAYWAGQGGAVAWRTGMFPRLELHADLRRIESLDDGVADLILCRELDRVLPLDGLEDGLARLHDLLRPGGEMIARVRCGDPRGGLDGPGYGFMTPTAWTALMLRAGFEVAGLRRVWRDPGEQDAAAARLPRASDDERLTAELHLHLIRPWESWELDALKEFGDQRRKSRKG